MDPEEKEEEMKFHKAKRDLKAVYGHSESGDNERRKMLHIMFRVPGTSHPGASSRLYTVRW
jgi:hypothetical protein